MLWHELSILFIFLEVSIFWIKNLITELGNEPEALEDVGDLKTVIDNSENVKVSENFLFLSYL